MSVARVVSFEGVSRSHMDDLNRQMTEGGGPPEGFPQSEVVILYDEAGEKSIVVFFFENDDDYRTADELLNAMPSDETPGSRTSVGRYDVVFRMKD